MMVLATFVGGVTSFVVMIFLFSLSIFIHEFGHLLAAVLCKMKVEAFSIGFGPSLWEVKKWGIKWRVGIVPLGGYVALPQLDPEGMQTVQGSHGDGDKDDKESDTKRYDVHVSPWKKIIVSLAGATGNVILSIVIAWIIYFSPDGTISDGDPVVGYVATNAPAYEAGLRIGDRIMSVQGDRVHSWDCFLQENYFAGDTVSNVVVGVERDGVPRELTIPLTFGDGFKTHTGIKDVFKRSLAVVGGLKAGMPAVEAGLQTNDVIMAVNSESVHSWPHMVDLMDGAGKDPVQLTVMRGEEKTSVDVTPVFSDELGRYIIGISMGRAAVDYMPWMQFRNPLAQLKHDASAIFRMLRALVSTPKSAVGGMGGPLLILAATWKSAYAGIFIVLGFIRFINVNLAVLNLLPIPVLDGGHIMFSLYEAITRRRIPAKVVNTLVNVFAILLLLFIGFLTVGKDLPRLYYMIVGDDPGGTHAVPAQVEGSNAVPEKIEGSETNTVELTAVAP